MKFNYKELGSIPNILSIVRVIMIPVFITMYLNAETVRDYRVAGVVILLSGFTDLLDGVIARKYNQITELGKLLDPLADKMTQAAIVFCLMLRFQYMWMIVVLFVVKETSMLIWNLVLIRQEKKLDGALWYGKVSTAVFYACMFLVITFPNIHPLWANSLMLVTGFFLFLSFTMYTKIFISMYRE